MTDPQQTASARVMLAILFLAVPACDTATPTPRSMWTTTEQFDADVEEYGRRNGPPLLKVVSADTGEPVPNVFVGMTLIGPDGGDGGYQQFLTGPDGVAPRWLPLTPGRYQFHLRPHPNSRFVHTEWRRSDPYVVVSDAGDTTVPTLTIDTDG
ncbi:hypothetical protein SH528x_004695 [Novipirellula sp. SH528]|uniref:hypothetical protein n=1 Tax=Novipirellula sp. SH528 TaxID=3454466 RepID=UPI003F9FE5CD